MIPIRWRGELSYTDAVGYEHRILSVEHGWKLRIADRQTGALVHQENGCRDIEAAMARDEAWVKTREMLVVSK